MLVGAAQAVHCSYGGLKKQFSPDTVLCNAPVGGPGRLPPSVFEEKALLYTSRHRTCSLSRS